MLKSGLLFMLGNHLSSHAECTFLQGRSSSTYTPIFLETLAVNDPSRVFKSIGVIRDETSLW